jgi:hypothetical protein
VGTGSTLGSEQIKMKEQVAFCLGENEKGVLKREYLRVEQEEEAEKEWDSFGDSAQRFWETPFQ